ncbi:CLUMA_CG005045, isoform A [Clunio marinus]|uniref:CLUMA_CG005045, isoform A n=1 Tax=Clunio marinus TaxID=568069 RepID=A0A1J1HVI8_9DIPT|nr:CLUMA_CG005045, isoform A [Clunio marinus]
MWKDAKCFYCLAILNRDCWLTSFLKIPKIIAIALQDDEQYDFFIDQHMFMCMLSEYQIIEQHFSLKIDSINSKRWSCINHIARPTRKQAHNPKERKDLLTRLLSCKLGNVIYDSMSLKQKEKKN